MQSVRIRTNSHATETMDAEIPALPPIETTKDSNPATPNNNSPSSDLVNMAAEEHCDEDEDMAESDAMVNLSPASRDGDDLSHDMSLVENEDEAVVSPH